MSANSNNYYSSLLNVTKQFQALSIFQHFNMTEQENNNNDSNKKKSSYIFSPRVIHKGPGETIVL